jgi:hypothetical protein
MTARPKPALTVSIGIPSARRAEIPRQRDPASAISVVGGACTMGEAGEAAAASLANALRALLTAPRPRVPSGLGKDAGTQHA